MLRRLEELYFEKYAEIKAEERSLDELQILPDSLSSKAEIRPGDVQKARDFRIREKRSMHFFQFEGDMHMDLSLKVGPIQETDSKDHSAPREARDQDS